MTKEEGHLDSLMMQADIANQEARLNGMDWGDASSFPMRVALAITQSCGVAGQAWSVDDMQDAETRAENLTRELGKYGAYIVAGDPYDWAEGALATILMEAKGTKGDCNVPLDYYGDGMAVAFRASERLDGCHIEFVNAAVAVVHRA